MPPDDLIELGVVRGAYGLKGWVHIAPFAADGVVLESVRRWWLRQGAAAEQLAVQQTRRHGESLVAKWEGCESREAADALKGATVAVARSEFPPLAEGEHYLSDVIGYRVVNREGVELGAASGLRTGKNRDQGGVVMLWLEVTSAVSEERGALLIPMVSEYVEAIEPDARLIRVDWQTGW